ncbi:MAG: amino acid ABC transporter substrate-binding protein [Xenococcaceae cyanobacterium MO_167.B52]|nr:amino acid ABC transporter substrate-binding protein [Xenococcaceae cyanobacterium MO_167.B52]
MNKQIKIILLSSILVVNLSLGIRAETVLEEIARTGILKVAVREDAVLFGYLDLNKDLRGYCLDLIALLKKRIKQRINREILTIRLFKSTINNRFAIVNNRVAHLECGPNTIKNNLRYDRVEFSQPFFITGTVFLIRKEDTERINLNTSLENITIGLLRGTTTAEFIAQKYPLATIINFQGVTGRTRGVQAVGQGKIDTFVSDDVLLLGEIVIQNLYLEEYEFIPQFPLTCDYYGLIIPKNDGQWRDLVNSVIDSQETEKVFTEWFGPFLPNLQKTIEFCQEKTE